MQQSRMPIIAVFLLCGMFINASAADLPTVAEQAAVYPTAVAAATGAAVPLTDSKSHQKLFFAASEWLDECGTSH